jgi:DNA phosphorothioation-associated putative methyltransferase
MAATPILDWSLHRQLLGSLPYGKVLPSAIYVHRDTDACRSGPFRQLLALLAERHAVGQQFNVVKFRTDAPRLSFLHYPSFFECAHPSLEEAVAIDLCSGRSFRTTYRDSLNPPILHRKELLLPPDHSRFQEFAQLSAAEEQAGLYTNTAVIGFRVNWERLLNVRGLAVEGHRLLRDGTVCGAAPSQFDRTAAVAVHRHKTALTRYQLSRPVKTIIEYGQLPSGSSFLDFGCGLGADIRGLCELGFDAFGWDPVHAPDGRCTEADVVNLGYVLNVIEDPAERLETLASAWRLTKRLLVVSALIGSTSADLYRGVTLNDGILTRRNTFQRYFGQQELQSYIEDAVETSPVPVALGIFYVFRDPKEQQVFLQSRSRRNVDWNSISLKLGKPDRSPREPRADRPARPDRFAEYLPLLEEFWSVVLPLGRLPIPQECPRYSELCAAFGSAKRALRRLLTSGRQEVFERAQAARKSDMLVYLASSNLRKVIPFLHLPETVRRDLTVFFGSYKRGLAQGRELLHSAADPNTIVLACDEAAVGWQDNRSLYLRTPLVDRLPTVLRTFIACAELLYGDVHEADILRIHKLTGKVTFLTYTDFESALLPRLAVRTRVNLRTVQVDVFDHTGNGQLLYFKERFLDAEDPQRTRLVSISDSLRQLGISDSTFTGPSTFELRRILDEAQMPNLAQELGLDQIEGECHDRNGS